MKERFRVTLSGIFLVSCFTSSPMIADVVCVLCERCGVRKWVDTGLSTLPKNLQLKWLLPVPGAPAIGIAAVATHSRLLPRMTRDIMTLKSTVTTVTTVHATVTTVG